MPPRLELLDEVTASSQVQRGFRHRLRIERDTRRPIGRRERPWRDGYLYRARRNIVGDDIEQCRELALPHATDVEACQRHVTRDCIVMDESLVDEKGGADRGDSQDRNRHHNSGPTQNPSQHGCDAIRPLGLPLPPER